MEQLTYVGESSVCEGKGLFAKVFLAKGTVWMQLNPDELFFDQVTYSAVKVWLPQLAEVINTYAYYNASKQGVCFPMDISNYVNHSPAAPNSGRNWEGAEGEFCVLRDVEAGEEILEDYTQYSRVPWFNFDENPFFMQQEGQASSSSNQVPSNLSTYYLNLLAPFSTSLFEVTPYNQAVPCSSSWNPRGHFVLTSKQDIAAGTELINSALSPRLPLTPTQLSDMSIHFPELVPTLLDHSPPQPSGSANPNRTIVLDVSLLLQPAPHSTNPEDKSTEPNVKAEGQSFIASRLIPAGQTLVLAL